MSKMKQRWRVYFCSSLLFIVTKITCKNLRICGYPAWGKTFSVDQTLPFLSYPLDFASIPLQSIMLKLYITLRLHNTGKKVGGKPKRVQNTEYWGRLVPEWDRKSRKFLGYLLSQIFPKCVTVLLSILAMQGNFKEPAERRYFQIRFLGMFFCLSCCHFLE